MSKLLVATDISSTASTSVVGFIRPPSEMWKGGFDRYLTLNGTTAFHIGNICGTCPPLFERLHGANEKVSAPQATAILRQGLIDLPHNLLQTIAALVPSGRYVATLLVIQPAKVKLGSVSDYFASEQVELWGLDPFWGLPHYPKIEYYRSATYSFDDQDGLFEFVVPMYPQTWLHEDTIAEYKQELMTGQKPTAVAVSVLDVKQPANWQGSPPLTRHWNLTHYLLDGHHKMFAASLVGKPLTLPSLLAVEECNIDSHDSIERLLRLLRALT